MYIEINGYEYYAECEYEHIRASKGSTNEYGVPMEPDEPSSVEISKVMVNYGTAKESEWHELPLSEDVLREMEAELLEEIEG